MAGSGPRDAPDGRAPARGGAGPAGAEPVLLERAAALAAIDAAVDAAAAGARQALFLIGTPGVGLSSLARTAAGAAARRDLVTRSSRLLLAEQDEPLAALARVAADDGPATASADPLRLPRADLVVIDDLHWADPASTAALGRSVRRAGRGAAVLVATLRAWPPGPVLLARRLAHEGLARILEVPPLTGPGAARLLGADIDIAEAAWRRTAGAPALLTALAGSEPAAAVDRLVIETFVAGLPAPEVTVAEALAVAGASELATVRAVSGLDADHLDAALDSLRALGAAAELPDGRITLLPPALASALAASSPPGRRRALHARAFRSLAERGRGFDAAPHAVAADLVGDAEAISVATAAAHEALTGRDPGRAVGLFDAAVDLSGSRPAAELLTARADALFAAGRASEAVDAYAGALELLADVPGRGDVLLRAARALTYACRFGEACATYDALLGGGEANGLLVLERAHAIWERDGPKAGLAALDAPHTADPGLAPILEAARGTYTLHLGDPRGLDALDRLVAAIRHPFAGRPPDPAASFNAFVMHASACTHVERFEEAEASIREGIRILGQAGGPRAAGALALLEVGSLVQRGYPRRALAAADAVERDFDIDPIMAPYLWLSRARALRSTGDLDGAIRAADTARALPGAAALLVRLTLDVAEAEQQLLAGRPDRAAELFGEVATEAEAVGFRAPAILAWAPGAIDAGAAVGDVALVERAHGHLQGAAALPGTGPRAWADEAAAVMALAAGDAAAAEEHLRRALSFPVPSALDRARVLIRHGSLLRRSRRQLQARPVLAEAVRIAEARGAAPLAVLAREELRAAGGRRRRANVEAGLTAQEARVARAAATGATMREIADALFVSPRTVETHLANIYRKLGVASKNELRRRQAEFGLDRE